MNLSRLRARMVEVGFLPGDPLFAAVVKAHDATANVHIFAVFSYQMASP